MTRLLWTLPLLAVAAVGVAQEGGKKSFPDPAPRTDAILKRFMAEFVPLTPGEGRYPARFVMGTESDGPKTEQPAHAVTLKHPFAIAKYEVTQELYQVVAGKNPSRWQGPRNSVELLSWPEAVAFCERVTAELRKRDVLAADEEIRLPTEAEWEYACRAGTTTAYSFGDDPKDLSLHAWYKGNAAGNDPPVGAKRPNPWGLYDVHGYLWEFCQDTWHDSYADAPGDGRAQVDGGDTRVIRGGAWTGTADDARSTRRRPIDANARGDDIGLRPVRAKRR